MLSYVPDRMLSFTWNAPPSVPSKHLGQTWVVVTFDELDGGGATVSLTHLGFGEGVEWDHYVSYFNNAWTSVLGKVQASFAE